MKAADVMTPRVVAVKPDAPLSVAIRLMLQNKISGLPVVDAAGNLVGIVTEGDLLRRAETGTERKRPRWLEFLVGPGKLAEDYVHSHGRTVDEVMTRDPKTIGEDTPLDAIVTLMEKSRIKRVPVMRGKEVVGIVSRANLLHGLASLSREAAAPVEGDAAIRERVLAEMEKQAWAPIGTVNVVVRNGVVEYWGSITEENQREALRVLAENVPGVTGVRDETVWVEPMSGMVILPSEQEQTQKVLH